MIANIRYLERGKPLSKPEYYDMQGWPPGETERFIPSSYDCSGAVEDFIVEHEAELGSRVKRNVGNDLRSGLKSLRKRVS